MTRRTHKVAVLGGGITGLSAAFYLARQAAASGERLELTVLEGSRRLGGRIHTLRRDGFVIERGPDSFLGRKLPMIRLAEDLGLTGELTGTNPGAKKTYISRNGQLHPMPEGLVLGVPTDTDAFMRTGLVSEEGKLRALEDREIVPGTSKGDESVGAFLERHMGAEMVTRIFEPLLAGIYAGDLYGLSLQATFPQFKEMERVFGSLIAGTIDGREKQQAQAAAAREAQAAIASTPLPASVFLTFKNGLSSVIEALEEKLKAYGCEIRLDARVQSLDKSAEGHRLLLSDGSALDADQVLIALPAVAMAELLAPHADVSALERIRYVSVANVVLGYDAASFDGELDGSGFLVPRGEGRTITASTWTSAKWLHTAPEGKRLIRCYVGRAGDEAGVALSDEAMTEAVRLDLRELMGVAAEPEFVEITRLRDSMPQYPVGHTEAIAAFQAGLSAALPGVIACGVPFGGVGLPDCVAQGKLAAESLWKQL
ncbi:protoporphyrinogen oxidase [Cohnella yongneupensis]|uniref:Coproporphyrinogen III oxidase n=1 Tax=Cohnella yongneupensis TaxID=425006 RepID=A0ABW0QZQ8_9BACL